MRPNQGSDSGTDSPAPASSALWNGGPALGPFQPIWNAWDVADGEVRELPLAHFREALRRQVEEMQEHLDNGRPDAAANEGIDMISIALNVLRWLGRNPEDIGRIAEERARKRLEGQTAAILEKYRV
ncbi:MAG: hypothetical protein KJO75_07370 [Dactylosporangium sp.]|nr:hypothetical protein [Dactylosporangium sp.]